MLTHFTAMSRRFLRLSFVQNMQCFLCIVNQTQTLISIYSKCSSFLKLQGNTVPPTHSVCLQWHRPLIMELQSVLGCMRVQWGKKTSSTERVLSRYTDAHTRQPAALLWETFDIFHGTSCFYAHHTV